MVKSCGRIGTAADTLWCPATTLFLFRQQTPCGWHPAYWVRVVSGRAMPARLGMARSAPLQQRARLHGGKLGKQCRAVTDLHLQAADGSDPGTHNPHAIEHAE